MFDRHAGGENAVLVSIDFPESYAEELIEFKELVRSSGVNEVAVVTGMRQQPEAKFFIGSGKAEEVRAIVLLEQADVVIVNHDLSPAQERNLECLIKCRVLSRSGLILAIFAQRARTFEGKLQVELAQLQHMSTRLIRGWTHLERQKGGIGLRGPGETQLETDRRLLRVKIKNIHARLKKVRSQREQNRRARRKVAMPTVSIVGYTNAGKSSLFNALTGEVTFVANQLFATLDPTMRKLELPGAGEAILADTVGFIRHLPHSLIEAFRATLEETRDANLLLHVVDIANPSWRDAVSAVKDVLYEIGANKVPVIFVYNKIDLLATCDAHFDDEGEMCRVWVSAHSGEGIELLRKAIVKKIYGDPVYRSLCLSSQEGKLRAELYQLEAVLSERIDDEGNWWLNVALSKKDFKRLFND